MSLVVPATGVLFGVGLMAVYQLKFRPIWIAEALRAFAGDWLAYEIILRMRDRIDGMPWRTSQAADLASAMLWAPGILVSGFIGERWLLA